MFIGVKKIMKNLKKKQSQRGASLVEYGLLVALIAVVAIAAVQFLGTEVASRFESVGSAISEAN